MEQSATRNPQSKILLSLIGEQPIPTLLPVRHLRPDANLLVYTTRTEPIARRLRRLLSGSDDLRGDVRTDAYDLPRITAQLREAMAGPGEVTFNLTGGTKMMAMAAYALAAQRSAPFVYLQSEGRASVLYEYGLQNAEPVLRAQTTLPALITIDDYLNAHLPGYATEGLSRDERGRITEGGLFERAVLNALSKRMDEVTAGVRPQGVDRQIEMDLVIRVGNQVGIAEVKLGGGESPKRGLDQLKMAGEPTYLGTYTAQFLIVAGRLPPPIKTLARRRNVEIVQLPGYAQGQPLGKREADELARAIRQKLCA